MSATNHKDCSSEKQKELIDYELEDNFDLLNCASSGDCTGSVYVAPHNREQWENYEEVYHFQPKASRDTKKL